MSVKFPTATATLIGADGNAFSVLAIVRKALRNAGATEGELKRYVAEATSGDYDNLLQVSMKWVNVK